MLHPSENAGNESCENPNTQHAEGLLPHPGRLERKHGEKHQRRQKSSKQRVAREPADPGESQKLREDGGEAQEEYGPIQVGPRKSTKPGRSQNEQRRE